MPCAARHQGRPGVGQTPNLDSIQNRLWFTLRQGSDPHADLQAAWKQHGADSFSFEVLERLKDDEDDLPFVRHALLKERQAHWLALLNAAPIR